MVHTVDTNFVLDDNITKSVTHAQLLDFSINIHNIKEYFNVGQVNEILRYTNISFAILSNMRGVEKIYSNENIMMHILENCSDTIGLFRYQNFRSYSLNVIKKIIEKEPQNFIDMFNNYYTDIYYENSEECHAKLIYVFEYYLTNDKDRKTGSFYSNCAITCKRCWYVYLLAHRIYKNDGRNTYYYKIQTDTNLIIKLQNLLKKINMEEKVFNREITADSLEDYDIELLKKTPYLIVNESGLSWCLIM